MRRRTLALACLGAGALTLGVIASTPSAAVPVGTANAQGDSMQPTIARGAATVYVADWPPAIGDVVIFMPGDGKQDYVQHRVIDEVPEGFLTRGDGAEMVDQPAYAYVTRDTYVGTVVLAIERDGRVIWQP